MQYHRATRRHFDLRLEYNGVMLSWAMPRGPSLDPSQRRLAVHVEDHPIAYGQFEGVIPSGYGMGTVCLWDVGVVTWVDPAEYEARKKGKPIPPRTGPVDVEGCLRQGDLKFTLEGSKLHGEFAIIRMKPKGDEPDVNWLLLKKRDGAVREGHEPLDEPQSVRSGRTIEEIAAAHGGDPRELRRRARTREAKPVDPSPAQKVDVAEALEALRRLGKQGQWTVAGRTLRLTNLDKLLWPEEKISKRDVIAYYTGIAPVLLPHLQGRPLTAQVFPDGIAGKSFWRKDIPGHAPDWLERYTYEEEKRTTYIVATETATLAWLANNAALELHPWHSRIDAPQLPDWVVFDLDPSPPAGFAEVVEVARLVKTALDHYHLRGYPKTTGQRGMQIYVPIQRGPSYAQVRTFVEGVGRAIGQVLPDRITWEWEVAKRGGRIRIDYTQNVRGKTLAAPYSLRPAAGAPVSTPIAWEELDDPDLHPNRWTLGTIMERIRVHGDLFAGALRFDQTLPEL